MTKPSLSPFSLPSHSFLCNQSYAPLDSGIRRGKNAFALSTTPVFDSCPVLSRDSPYTHNSDMDQFRQPHHPQDSFDLPPLTNPPPQYFGGNDNNGSPTMPNFDFTDGDGQDNDGGHDEGNDAKRRRIARVCTWSSTIRWLMALTFTAGL